MSADDAYRAELVAQRAMNAYGEAEYRFGYEAGYESAIDALVEALDSASMAEVRGHLAYAIEELRQGRSE